MRRILARSGVAVPARVLARHLNGLGLPSRTNGAGGIVLAALEPGRWEVFIAHGSNATTIRTGRPFGFLTAADVLPRETVELDVVSER